MSKELALEVIGTTIGLATWWVFCFLRAAWKDRSDWLTMWRNWRASRRRR